MQDNRNYEQQVLVVLVVVVCSHIFHPSKFDADARAMPTTQKRSRACGSTWRTIVALDQNVLLVV